MLRVNGHQPFRGFQLDDQPLLHEQVHLQAFVIHVTVQLEGHRPLTLHGQAPLSEPVSHDAFIYRLQKAGPDVSMQVVGTVDDARRELFDLHCDSIMATEMPEPGERVTASGRARRRRAGPRATPSVISPGDHG